jgi:transcription elongation factor/antiterminator RfaH
MIENFENSGSAARTLNTAMFPVPRVGRRWYAVQCLSYREFAAASHLQNQDFAVFLPRRKKIRRHARRTDSVLVSFFPGYLFVSFDLSRDRWRSINGTHGVASLVMQGDYPAPVPVGVVESLQQACDDMSVIQWQPDLAPGEPVRVLAGPFSDMIGELDRLDGAGRVRVLLDIMGGRIPTVLPRESIVSRDSIV